MTNISKLSDLIRQFHSERIDLESKLDNLYDSPASDAPARIKECLTKINTLKKESERMVYVIDTYLTTTRKAKQ